VKRRHTYAGSRSTQLGWWEYYWPYLALAAIIAGALTLVLGLAWWIYEEATEIDTGIVTSVEYIPESTVVTCYWSGTPGKGGVQICTPITTAPYYVVEYEAGDQAGDDDLSVAEFEADPVEIGEYYDKEIR
jgi:hypothetical protein